MGKQKISVQINIASFAHGIPGVSDRQKYTRALKAELASAADYAEDYTVDALCITGSNPMQYPPEAFMDIIETLRNILEFQQNTEFIVNALPGSVTYSDLHALQGHGVNRVSFDMYTFIQAELDALGRTYSPSAMEVFMRMVQLKMAFFNYDVTLYYGLPGQTLESFGFSIEQAIRYQAMHISLLPYEGANETELSIFYQQAVNILGLTSFQQYTPFHFARPEYFSRWVKSSYSNQPRLGFGAGTWSKIDGMFSQNTSDVGAYISAEGDPSSTISRMEAITANEIEVNSLLDGLFNLRNCDLKTYSSGLRGRTQSLCEHGFLAAENENVILAAAGKQNWPFVVNALTQ